MSQSNWTVTVSVFFALAVWLFPLPEVWKAIAGSIAAAGLLLAVAGWIIAHTWLASWVSTHGLSKPKVAIPTVVILGVALSTAFWFGIRPDRPTLSLLVEYSTTMLPISVSPNSTDYVLQLHPGFGENDGVAVLSNDSNAVQFWPVEMAEVSKPDYLSHSGRVVNADLAEISGPDAQKTIVVCSLTNFNDATLVDVVINFEIKFYALASIRAAIRTNPGGTKTVEVEEFGADEGWRFWVMAPDDRVAAFTTGALVATTVRRAFIRSIESKQRVQLYVVNQSELVAGFHFPMEASVVSDQAARKLVRFVRPRVTLMDQMPWMKLAPTDRSWHGWTAPAPLLR